MEFSPSFIRICALFENLVCLRIEPTPPPATAHQFTHLSPLQHRTPTAVHAQVTLGVSKLLQTLMRTMRIGQADSRHPQILAYQMPGLQGLVSIKVIRRTKAHNKIVNKIEVQNTFITLYFFIINDNISGNIT